MKKIIQAEELVMTITGIYLITLLNLSLSWWVYVLLFFAPDISIMGYVINKKIGAVAYNLFHHKGIALIIACFGIFYSNEYVTLTGLILLSHASFDRILGYGLKHFIGFKHTHLGVMK